MKDTEELNMIYAKETYLVESRKDHEVTCNFEGSLWLQWKVYTSQVWQETSSLVSGVTVTSGEC